MVATEHNGFAAGLADRFATLDRHAAAFAAALLRAYPAWSGAARCAQGRDMADWFVVAVPPPVGADLAGPLEIEAAHGDVTVFFDRGRAQFPIDADAPESIAPVLALLDGILCGEVMCLTELERGEPARSRLLRLPGATASPPGSMCLGGRPVRVRSWRAVRPEASLAA